MFSTFFPLIASMECKYYISESISLYICTLLCVLSEVILLVNITVTMSDEAKRLMDRMPEVNWSEVARQGIEEGLVKLELIKKIDKFLEDDKLSNKEISELIKEFGKFKAG